MGLTRADMRAAVKSLHDEAELRMAEFPQARRIFSADPAKTDGFAWHKIFCRDADLSLPASGAPVNIMLMDSRITPTLTKENLDAVFGFCAFFIHLDRNPHQSQHSMKKAHWRLEARRAAAAPRIQTAVTEGSLRRPLSLGA